MFKWFHFRRNLEIQCILTFLVGIPLSPDCCAEDRVLKRAPDKDSLWKKKRLNLWFMVSMRPSGFACTRKVAMDASQMIRFFVFKSSWMRTKNYLASRPCCYWIMWHVTWCASFVMSGGKHFVCGLCFSVPFTKLWLAWHLCLKNPYYARGHLNKNSRKSS